jgi:threonine/homoserine/homoserine lactone efflux protein
MKTINENKKILEWFRDHTDKVLTIYDIVLGIYILLLGITTNIDLYSKIALIFGGAYFLWLGYYTYKEGVKNESW